MDLAVEYRTYNLQLSQLQEPEHFEFSDLTRDNFILSWRGAKFEKDGDNGGPETRIITGDPLLRIARPTSDQHDFIFYNNAPTMIENNIETGLVTITNLATKEAKAVTAGKPGYHMMAIRTCPVTSSIALGFRHVDVEDCISIVAIIDKDLTKFTRRIGMRVSGLGFTSDGEFFTEDECQVGFWDGKSQWATKFCFYRLAREFELVNSEDFPLMEDTHVASTHDYFVQYPKNQKNGSTLYLTDLRTKEKHTIELDIELQTFMYHEDYMVVSDNTNRYAVITKLRTNKRKLGESEEDNQ